MVQKNRLIEKKFLILKGQIIDFLKLNSLIYLLILNFLSIPANATTDFSFIPDNCEELAQKLSKGSGIPDGLLASISRVEAGRINEIGVKRAWPWTLNLAGDSKFFDSKSQMLRFLRQAISEGKKNIDIGCMQINYRWHKDNFLTVEDMVEPTSNINYAIKFLKQLFNKHDSWEEAVKHYHSATKSLNTKYYRKIARVFNDIRSETSNSTKSFISSLPPLPNSGTDSLNIINSRATEKLAYFSSTNIRKSNIVKSINSSKNPEKKELIEVNEDNSHYEKIDFTNVAISFDQEYKKPKAHLPKYIKENWKLVLAMRTILGNN